MAILVFVECAEGKVKTTSVEAISFAHAMGEPVVAIALGTAEKSELEGLGKYGAAKILHASNEKLQNGVIQAYASVLAKAMADESADTLIIANSSLGTPVAAPSGPTVHTSCPMGAGYPPPGASNHRPPAATTA